MREILFRGKRIDNGEWVYGYYAQKGADEESFCHYICVSTFSSDYQSNYTYPFYLYDYEVGSSTVGQYIGLTDKNGKKIFEGDILDYFGISYVVSWSKELLAYIVTSVNEKKDYLFYLNKANMDEVYVIGNIHDNPELLEVKE